MRPKTHTKEDLFFVTFTQFFVIGCLLPEFAFFKAALISYVQCLFPLVFLQKPLSHSAKAVCSTSTKVLIGLFSWQRPRKTDLALLTSSFSSANFLCPPPDRRCSFFCAVFKHTSKMNLSNPPTSQVFIH